jgi:hypothetical protein
MAISYGEPKNRIFHFQRKFLKFDIQTIKISKGKGSEANVHYIYMCKKLEDADKVCEQYFTQCLKEI